ncbi:MAG: MBL fold metallo-hydrolase [Ruminococcaceae bacterium]|nr:MBL fold metallo-hydrolase [Oscillospiraceae bacterium]
MKIQFLGTGAADWPKEKDYNMPEFRRLSSALVDDCLLIDPGPGVPNAIKEYGIDAKSIKYILVTHSHGDHYNQSTFDWLVSLGAERIVCNAGETVNFGTYTVRAYTANHGTAKDTVHYLISDDSKTLFYGLDGAWLMYEEVQAIKEYRPDYAVLDATIGGIDGDYRIFEHNNLGMIREMQKTLSPYVGRFCISHMAMTLHTDHKTLAANMAKTNIDTAFDGMIVEF